MYEFHKDFTQSMMKKIVSFITKWLIECGIELQSSTKVKKKRTSEIGGMAIKFIKKSAQPTQSNKKIYVAVEF